MRMYDDLAELWPLVSAPEDYAEEAAEHVRLVTAAALRPVRTMLELGSGGGNNASHHKAHWALTLVEPAPGMRAVSERLNPECEHLAGDMRSVRLGRTFDAVFVHDAICYMATEADLRAAIETVAVHLAPGGVALLCPDATIETFTPGASAHGNDDPSGSGRGVRMLEWSLPARGPVFEVHYAILIREPDGQVRSVHDVHREGVFPRATWLRLLAEAGLGPRLETRVIEGEAHDAFVAVRPVPPGGT
jgi:SAM-dependent methyltransferase